MADAEISLLAHGKINLTLAVTGRRADGYHTLSGVMQSIGLANRLRLSLTEAPGVVLHCNDAALPTDEKNTAVKAALLLLEAAKATCGVSIWLEKEIPYQAGLGSASADAAGVLYGLNALLPTPLSPATLFALGTRVGADVPFCLTGGTQQAEGIGELLSPLPSLPASALLIAKPAQGMSTPAAYALIDASPTLSQPASDTLLDALARQDLLAAARSCGNVFEAVCPIPIVGALRQAMLEQGALGSAMSGSGTAVFGVFLTKQQAQAALSALSETFSDCCFYCTEPVSHAIEVIDGNIA